MSQASSLFRQSQHKRKIRDKTRGIVHNFSDRTCTKKYALTEGPERVGGGVAQLPPPSHFVLATGVVLKEIIEKHKHLVS